MHDMQGSGRGGSHGRRLPRLRRIRSQILSRTFRQIQIGFLMPKTIGIRSRIRQRARNRCERCFCKTTHENNSPKQGTIHHRFPRRNGGRNTMENLLLLCLSCHRDVHADEDAAVLDGFMTLEEPTRPLRPTRAVKQAHRPLPPRRGRPRRKPHGRPSRDEWGQTGHRGRGPARGKQFQRSA